jgi:hypothetical protein
MIFNLWKIQTKIKKKRNNKNKNLSKRYLIIDKILVINLEVVHKMRLILDLMDRILISRPDLKVSKLVLDLLARTGRGVTMKICILMKASWKNLKITHFKRVSY